MKDYQKKPLKKVYLEVTNACNLSCDFCIQNKRPIHYLSLTEFEYILTKLEKYTDYLYFHILGEPLMHPQILDLIELASNKFKINITTNGYLINKIASQKNIRQVNISLHSFNPKYHVSLEEYLMNIFDSVSKIIANKTYVSLRLWVDSQQNKEIIQRINHYYQCNIIFKNGSYKIKDYLFVSTFHQFIWPDLENDYYQKTGTCYAIRDHIGILSDGTIIPCCLDTKGIINLGNIYQTDLETVINSPKCQNMLEGFRCHQKREELCKHCSFIE